jgi:hypothetical protein
MCTIVCLSRIEKHNEWIKINQRFAYLAGPEKSGIYTFSLSIASHNNRFNLITNLFETIYLVENFALCLPFQINYL